MKTTTLSYLISTSILFRCADPEKLPESKIEYNQITSIEKQTENEQQPLITNVEYNINGISTNDTFNLEIYIKKLGNPDSLKKGGPDIIEEFGHDDYFLWYGKNYLYGGHSYLLRADIFTTGISFNGIQIGDSIQKIKTTYKVMPTNLDTIIISDGSDCLLTFLTDKKIIKAIYYWAPI